MGSLKDDYVLPADGTATVKSEAIANAPLQSFLGVFQAAALTGFVPLYTKTVATISTCVEIFGMKFCDKKDATTWCGVLGGNCQTQMSIAGMTMWVPGLCAYTRTICRLGEEKGEADMKALVTAGNLGVSTIDLPCMSHTGLPPSMNCPIAKALGINATMHQVQVHGFIDGPRPDNSEEMRKDLDDSESMLNLVTSLVIAVGTLGSLCSFSLTACCVWRLNKAPSSKSSAPAGPHDRPRILTSQPQSTKPG